MKKLMTLAALLAVGGWIAGCGESTPPAKTPSPTVTPGAPAGHKPPSHDAEPGDKGTEEEKPAADKAGEGTEAGDEKPADGEATPAGEEKAPE